MSRRSLVEKESPVGQPRKAVEVRLIEQTVFGNAAGRDVPDRQNPGSIRFTALEGVYPHFVTAPGRSGQLPQ